MLLCDHSWSFFEDEHPCGGHVDVQGLLELKQTRVSVSPEFHRSCHYWMEEGLNLKQVKRHQFASVYLSFLFCFRDRYRENPTLRMLLEAETTVKVDTVHQHTFIGGRLGNTCQMWTNQSAVRQPVGLCSICWHIISGGKSVHCCANQAAGTSLSFTVYRWNWSLFPLLEKKRLRPH